MDEKGERVMKRTISLLIILFCASVLSGCAIGNLTVKESQKAEATIASLIGVEKLTLDHWAGIAQADADISSEPVSVRHINALQKYANKESAEYKSGYSGISKVYYQGYKLEGAIKKFIKKLTDYGVMIP
jgi:hypothetical protein